MYGNKKPLTGKTKTLKVWWPQITRKQMLAIKAAVGFFNYSGMTPEFEELMIKAAGKGHLKFEEIVSDPQKKHSNGFNGLIHVYFDVEDKYKINGKDMWGDECMKFTNHVFYGDVDRKRFNAQPDRKHQFPILSELRIPTFSATYHTDWLKKFLALE